MTNATAGVPSLVRGSASVDAPPDSAALIRALASDERLAVVRVLAAGASGVPELARELNMPPTAVRRHLRALERVGLVRRRTGDSRVYELARDRVQQLHVTLVGALRGVAAAIPVAYAGVASGNVPTPPRACMICANAGFVGGVLGDLGVALSEAREYHDRIQQMSSQVLSAHEAERKRIARELHDDTAQALTSILVRLRLLEHSAAGAEVLRNVEELRDLTGSALDAVRRMAMDLRPASLDDLGLVPALRAYVEKYSQDWPVVATLTVKGIKRRLPRDLELVLYRVAQEALANVAKHARAGRAEVTLSRHRNEVSLVISDDGIGIQPTRGPGGGSGLGLFGMSERLALVNGVLGVKSAPGKGTVVTARVRVSARKGRDSAWR